jgi:hypothetical protein
MFDALALGGRTDFIFWLVLGLGTAAWQHHRDAERRAISEREAVTAFRSSG